MTFDDLIQHFARWLDGTGEESGLVVSSRIRLARNLRQVRFTSRASEEDRGRVVEAVKSAASGCRGLSEAVFMEADRLSEMDRQLLVERHLISPALAGGEGRRGVLINRDQTFSVMVNEEDHLRLQAILSGFQPGQAYALASEIDADLAKALPYAYSSRWGHLTACPTNVGTGLRASVLIHLPGLVLTQDMEKVLRGITQMGFAVRGFYGEGTDVVGNLFQISNQITLGKGEGQIVEELEKVTRQIISFEQNARQTLLKEARPQIEDKIWRAYGILENARVLTTQEFMNLSSAARLGRSLGVIPRPDVRALNELMVRTQPSHIQRSAGKALEPAERDVLRAEIVRKWLEDKKN
jgi:protein arginine kinase